jgi:hypothetical protein
MHRNPITVLMALFLLLLSGCLLEETRHTLYLEPDGAVTWRVIRDLVRSDCDRLDERADEEAVFLAAVDGGEESWTESFAELGAAETSVELLRTERPYTVVVRARFDHVETLLATLLAELGDEAGVAYVEDGSRRSLRIALPGEEELSPEEPEGPREPAEEEPRAGAFRIVLTQGRFVEAEGFALAPDGAWAEPLDGEDEPRELLLVWDVDA